MADVSTLVSWGAAAAVGLVAYKTYRLANLEAPVTSPNAKLATKHERLISAKDARNFANGGKQPILFYEHIFGNSYMIHTGHYKYFINTADIEEYVRKRYYLKSEDVPASAVVPPVVAQVNFKA
jgi:hypothetical protein